MSNQAGAWIADCYLQKIDGNGEYECRAAVWADGVSSVRSLLLDALFQTLGYKVLWLDGCLPVRQYLTNHGGQAKIAPLARAVHPGHLVELSRLVEVSGGEPEPESYLIIEEIEGVEPLDAQLGVHPRKNVPDALMEPLFGQPKPTEAEIEHYGSTEAVPPLKTYAILDAGKFQFGRSEIERCDLPFKCLFKGDAAEELKDVAPYLIELSAEADFTRRLLTHNPNMPDTMTTVHLWHKEPGIYIRSRASFETLWKHFRKFTRIQDENGKWYYFRFWEPKAAVSAFKSLLREQKEALGFMVPRNELPLSSVLIFQQSLGHKVTLNSGFESVSDAAPAPFILTSQKREQIDHDRGERFEKEFADKLFDISPMHRKWLGIETQKPVEQAVRSIADQARRNGFKARNEVGKLASFAYFTGTYALNDPRITRLKQDVLLDNKHKPIRRIQAFEEALEQNNIYGIFLSNASLNLVVEALPKIHQGGSTALTELVQANEHLLPRETRNDFIAACRDQCQKWGLATEEEIYVHAFCAIVFTPFFMDDPLHGVLHSLFAERKRGGIISAVTSEFERRLAA